MNKTEKISSYDKITNKIIESLEKNVRPWSKPWNSTPVSFRPLRHNGIPYKGVNVILLAIAMVENNFTSPYWMTFKQAEEMKAKVRKGEKSSFIFIASTYTPKNEDGDGSESESNSRRFMKTYPVFNAQQIDNLPQEFYGNTTKNINPEERSAEIDSYFDSTKATIIHRGDSAHYSVSNDTISMPVFNDFNNSISYYSTLAHEIGHWTGAGHRLNRDLTGKFNDPNYAFEELIAELSAVFICANLNLPVVGRDDHTSYIGAWLKILKNDNRAIVRAAKQAEDVAVYVQNLVDKNRQQDTKNTNIHNHN